MSWFDTNLSFLSPGWVGSLIGLIGVLGGVIAYFRSRKRTSLSFAYLGEHLLGSESSALPEGISVQYYGEDIPRLTRSVIVLWNSGENTILGTEVVDIDPLRFSVGTDGKLLSASILKASRPVNDFRIRPPSAQAPNEAVVELNYFDSTDGVVVEILHTSTSRHPDIKGTVRGLPNGLKSLGRMSRSPDIIKRIGPHRWFRSFFISLTIWIPIILGMAFMLAALFGSPETLKLIMTFNVENLSTPVMTMGCFYIVMGLIPLYLFRRKHPKNLHIDALE
ncbi:hypothetical protein HF257_05585 [Pseudomonas sp. WS 5106]|uniref:Uncharacterized protein n=1 Tax=Pseudomonas cremoris TaxID=2724178 RepID=A0A7X1AKK5_9PSED|nr:hypothetical protein [Pseudomonas cremoris]MBC2405466.1 hypothetical protein [Pseudomonas cremoris]